jgi:hypothetical protein
MKSHVNYRSQYYLSFYADTIVLFCARTIKIGIDLVREEKRWHKSSREAVEFLSDSISLYIRVLRNHRCYVIILIIHASTEDKIDYVKDSFYMKPESLFDKFPK